MNNERLLQELREHLATFPERQREVHEMRMLMFGNQKTGEVGMKQKVDEIHDILTQSRGVIAFFGGVKGAVTLVIVIGAAITILKDWLIK